MLLSQKASTFRIVLDEPVKYLGNCNGSGLVRGEVIVNFSKDTPIQGPISLVFKGIQTVHPWFELMNQPTSGKSIKTIIHRIDLSILPPSPQAVMMKGVQRFPFEFPIPGWLPTTIIIPSRMNIYYSVTATLHKSSQEAGHSWMDWSRFAKKNKLSSTAYLRIVRLIETLSSLPAENVSGTGHHQRDVRYRGAASEGVQYLPDQESNGITSELGCHQTWDSSQRDHSAISLYTLCLDEQYDHLASSMRGRSVDNFSQPLSSTGSHGVRYRLGVDRTAIAIGTNFVIHVHVEPLEEDIKIRALTAKLSETRAYSIKVPGDFWSGKGAGVAQTLKATDTVSMALKWAHGITAADDEKSNSNNSSDDDRSDASGKEKRYKAPAATKLSQKYHHQCSRQEAVASTAPQDHVKCSKAYSPGESPLNWEQDFQGESSHNNIYATVPPTCDKLINLKELDEPVHVGKYFDGNFALPVPRCTDMLRPTMNHDSLCISHWLDLEVIIERNKKIYKLTMGSPIRVLDCRLVAHNDDQQTILPPPPEYEEATSSSYASLSTDIWAQRWPITQDASWGMSSQCPCQLKHVVKSAKGKQSPPISLKDTLPSSYSR